VDATTSLVYDIRHVADVLPVEGGLRILFREGTTALLDAAHPDFEILRIDAEHTPGRPAPVGVVLAPDGRVVDLNAAHDTTVRLVRPFPNDPDRLEVWFWGYSPACALTREQPEFERIRATLIEAIPTREMLWIAVHSKETVDEDPDEEGCIGTYRKLMDVRPIPIPAGSHRPAPDRVNGVTDPRPSSPHGTATC
jgi:hypothetical protein